jgi:hypothetical protein
MLYDECASARRAVMNDVVAQSKRGNTAHVEAVPPELRALTTFAGPLHVQEWSDKVDSPELARLLPTGAGPLPVGTGERCAMATGVANPFATQQVADNLVSTEETGFPARLKIRIGEYAVWRDRIVRIQLNPRASIDDLRIRDGITRWLVSRIWQFLSARLPVKTDFNE